MQPHEPKYIFVTGGVISSLGKGIASSSIGALLKARGLDVSILKLDPYLNVDPGTMNPFQHGEVFVTKDGAETDLDLGHYERFLDKELKKDNSKTSGQIYLEVLEKERRGDYLGETVQVIPHVTDLIKESIKKASKNHDILICEIGGTIGDIESLPFIEAIRQFKSDVGSKNALFIHVSYVPLIKTAGELKTKPTQHSVKEALSQGIQPDILLLRAEDEVPLEIKAKIALFCNVEKEAVINCPDAKSVYQVPLILHKEGIDDIIVSKLNIWARKPDLLSWENLNQKILSKKPKIIIAVVGKYANFHESYKSIQESLVHAGFFHNIEMEALYLNSDSLKEEELLAKLKEAHGLLVPGGFGERGFLGKIAAIKYAREHKLPFLGICLGLQVAVIEFARNVLNIKDATSEEFDKFALNKVIHVMETQISIQKKGGTMRLGNYLCDIVKNSLAHKVYQKLQTTERHRHRFEVNNEFVPLLEKNGLKVSGVCKEADLVEMVELLEHPFFMACQFHPEFLSRPMKPHPLFNEFIKEAIVKKGENP